MTCIVGLEHAGEVWMGGDASASADTGIRVLVQPKVFQKDTPTRGVSLLIGFAGSFRLGQIIEHSFMPPEIGRRDPLAYLITTFTDSLRELYKDKGCHTAVDEDGDDRGESLLIGLLGRLYFMDVDFHIAQPVLPIYAIGSGADIAIGSLYSTPKQGPEKRVLTALSAAAEFSTVVRKPFTVLSL